jgi:hypothetical protein
MTYLISLVFTISAGEGLNPAFTSFTLDLMNFSFSSCDNPACFGHAIPVADTRLQSLIMAASSLLVAVSDSSADSTSRAISQEERAGASFVKK